jgi:hypothetical protein
VEFSRLMQLSRARVDVAQTHRFPEFLQAPRQTACQAVLQGVKRLEWGSLGVMGAAVAGWILFRLLGSFWGNDAGLHGVGLHEDLTALVDGDGLRGGLLTQFGEDGGVFWIGGEVGVLGGIGFMGNL